MICLICLTSVSKSKFNCYHEKCFRHLFNTTAISEILPFSRTEFFQEKIKTASQRISISGVQPKLALKIENKKIDVATAGSTHIIKPSPEEFSQAAENEHLTMLLSQKFGIETAVCGLMKMKNNELAYITKRFDIDFKLNQKIHQEDMIQAMDIHPAIFSNAKYEAKSYEDICHFLKKTTGGLALPLQFITRLIFNFLIANNDYHLKNISIQYRRNLPGMIKLTPQYDSLNTTIYGLQDSELACPLLKGNDGFSASHDKYGFHSRYCFQELAKRLQINQIAITRIEKKVIKLKPLFLETIQSSHLNEELKQKYKKVYEEKFNKFFVGVS